MNKIFYSLLVILLTATSLQAQSLEPEVLATSGGNDAIPGASFSWTLGEIAVVSTARTPDVILTQGFHQPFSIGIVGIEERDVTGAYVLGADLSIFPNPTAEIVHLRSKFSENVSLNVKVSNLEGQQVFTSSERKLPAGVQETSFDLNGLAQGTYLLQIHIQSLTGDQQEIQNVKINVLSK